MKKFLLLLIVFLFSLVVQTQAQVDRIDVADDKEIISVTNNTYLNTTSSVYSEIFSLTQQDAFSWYTYPWRLYITGSVPTTGDIKAILYLRGSFDKTLTKSSWTVLDTIKAADSTYDATPFDTTANFNNYKYPYYIWEYDGQTANVDSAYITTKMWNPKKDVIKDE